MSQTAINAGLEAEFAAVAASSGCELVHTELRGDTLRVFLDRPEGVTVDDCAAVSRELSALLDVHDFSHRRYLLEVSSPGLDRRLYSPRDYERFRGRLIRVAFESEGAKKIIVGRLDDFSPPADDSQNADGAISVVLPDGGDRFDIPLRDISSARLEIEL